MGITNKQRNKSLYPVEITTGAKIVGSDERRSSILPLRRLHTAETGNPLREYKHCCILQEERPLFE